MTTEDVLKADLISMLRGNRWSHKDADQRATRLVDGIQGIAKEVAEGETDTHEDRFEHEYKEEY